MACALSMKTVMGLRMNLLISRWADITMSLLSLLIVAGGAGWDAEVGPQMLEAPALCFRLSTTREAISTSGATDTTMASPYRLLQPRIAHRISRRAANPLRYVLAPVDAFPLNLSLTPRERATFSAAWHLIWIVQSRAFPRD
jgi:hypothetical protein